MAADFERFIDLGRVVRAVSLPDVQGSHFARTVDGGWVAVEDTAEEGGNYVSSQGTARARVTAKLAK